MHELEHATSQFLCGDLLATLSGSSVLVAIFGWALGCWGTSWGLGALL